MMNLNDLSTSKPVVRKKAKKESIWNKDISFGGRTISDREKSYIYHQLFNLIDSGIDIRYSFEILEGQIKSKSTKEKMEAIRGEVVGGKSLSDAMKDSSYFTNYEYYSVKIGEETGKLNAVLMQLSQYYDDKLTQKRQIISALSYPVLILFSSLGAIAFMMLFIIPMFEEIFARFGSNLPAVTVAIITMAEFTNDNILVLLLAVVVITGLNYSFSKSMKLRYIRESFVLRLPVFGAIYKDIFLARFCSSMALLISSEVPIVSALEMVRNMINFQNLERPIEKIRQEIVAGKTLYETMTQYKIFGHEMVALVKVGEEVNKLGTFFDKLAKNYTDAAKHKTNLMGTVLEPVMIIFLGLIVGVILIAMYLPMFELSSNIGVN